ncbi:MAG TPA: nucleotidyltransferase domain-containing protein [Candidatus Dormibacteraeota bacterium]|nr:nucleotidyltransferase domain-containing protein [Candidatus Dormibacteraeota bacterium]
MEQRDRVRDGILEIARADTRIVAGAMIGSLAAGDGDRWSDLDLGFGLADGVSPAEVMANWTPRLEREHGAVHLFDLASLSSLYRVFLLPGNLQVDLSFTPASDFGARGPKFKVLFGSALERAPGWETPPMAHYLFGLGTHHAVRARFCIERGRLWQAEFWISGVRDQALALACRRRGLNAWYGRGYDDLPADVLDERMLVRSVRKEDLLQALDRAIDALLREAGDARDIASKVEAWLRQL